METCKQGTNLTTGKKSEIGITCGVCSEYSKNCQRIQAIKRRNLTQVVEHHALQGTSRVIVNHEASSDTR